MTVTPVAHPPARRDRQLLRQIRQIDRGRSHTEVFITELPSCVCVCVCVHFIMRNLVVFGLAMVPEYCRNNETVFVAMCVCNCIET